MVQFRWGEATDEPAREDARPTKKTIETATNNKLKMKTKNLFLLPALIAALNLMPAGRVTAQTFTTLHGFTASASFPTTNSDGANPIAGLITNSSGNTLYGTAQSGGSSANGTVFAVSTDGTGFTNLHSFTATPNYPNPTFDTGSGFEKFSRRTLRIS